MLIVRKGLTADLNEQEISCLGSCGCDVDDCYDDGGCGCDN